MVENNNKEAFKLLDLTGSESGSDVAEFTLRRPARRKVRLKKKLRAGGSHRVPSPRFCHDGNMGFGMCSLVVVGILFVFGSLGTLTWFTINIHGRVISLSQQLQNVEAGSQDLPEAMHEYHTQLQELQKNQSLLWGKMSTFTQQISDLNKEVREIKEAVKLMKKNLEAAPELVSVPKDVDNIKKSVALFGSQIADLETTMKDLKEEGDNTKSSYKKMETKLDTVKHQVETLKGTTGSQQLSLQHTQEMASLWGNVTELSRTLTVVNTTVSGRLQFAAEDIHEHNGKITNLQDTAQNLKSRVQTLENTCRTLQTHYSELENLTLLPTELSTQEGKITELDLKVEQLGTQYSELVNSQVSVNSSIHQLIKALPGMHQQQTQTTKPASLSVRGLEKEESKRDSVTPSSRELPTLKLEGLQGTTVSVEEARGTGDQLVTTSTAASRKLESSNSVSKNSISDSTKQLLQELDEAERTQKQKDLHRRET